MQLNTENNPGGQVGGENCKVGRKGVWNVRARKKVEETDCVAPQ